MAAIYNQPHVPTLDKSLTFLMVDDFEAMRRSTVNQLRQLGAEKVLTAVDGKAALRILNNQPVDIVLSDWNMPVMSGLDLLQAMRADAKLFAMPFVMITAEAERQHIEEAIACGVTSMILKPYSPAHLMSRVEKALNWKPRLSSRTGTAKSAARRQNGSTTVGAAKTRELQRPTILIVDDTPDNLMLLSELLKDEYRVRLSPKRRQSAGHMHL
ncbi:MAG: response regulator [Comamonadaceae bacterium]|nr:response regulator [Comamonadaceae bacterium]